MTRAPSIAALALAAVSLAACATPVRTEPVRSRTQAYIGRVETSLHEHFDSLGVTDVAVERPKGDAPAAVRDAFREALYAGLIARRYSPLDPAYVDAAGGDVARPEGPHPMTAAITSLRRTADGGIAVSGWAALHRVRADGVRESLYVCEVSDLIVPPVPGTDRRGGGPETGERLGAAVLRKLPAR